MVIHLHTNAESLEVAVMILPSDNRQYKFVMYILQNTGAYINTVLQMQRVQLF